VGRRGRCAEQRPVGRGERCTRRAIGKKHNALTPAARSTSVTYLSDTTIIRIQKIVDTPPVMLAGLRGMPCSGLKVSLTA